MKDYIDKGDFYPMLTPVQIQQCCNGMGAEWMGEDIREILDKVFDEFEDCVDVHDVDYCCKEKKEVADKRFLSNMRKACWYEIPWYRPLKFARFLGWSRALYLAVHLHGDKAYEEAQPPQGFKVNH
jgi:hypothetical protein